MGEEVTHRSDNEEDEDRIPDEHGGSDDPGLYDDSDWDLGDQFGALFADEDLTVRTFTGVETRLRSASITSTLTDLLSTGIATLTALLGSGTTSGTDTEGRR